MTCGCAERRQMLKTAYQTAGKRGVVQALPAVAKHMISRKSDAVKPSVKR